MSARLSQKHAAHADKAVRAPFTRFLNRPWATGQPKRQERGCLHPRTVRKTPAAFADVGIRAPILPLSQQPLTTRRYCATAAAQSRSVR